jgi:hypothetical protein
MKNKIKGIAKFVGFIMDRTNVYALIQSETIRVVLKVFQKGLKTTIFYQFLMQYFVKCFHYFSTQTPAGDQTFFRILLNLTLKNLTLRKPEPCHTLLPKVVE